MLEKLALNKDNLGNQLYLFCFSLYLIVNFMAGTTLSRALGLGAIVILLRLSQLAVLLVFCKIIIFDRHKFNTILAILVGACFLFIVCKQAHELDPFFMYVCIYVCVYVCIHACECLDVLACVRRPRLMLSVFLKSFPPYVLRQGLSLNLDSQIGQGSRPMISQGHSCCSFPMAG